MRRIGRYEIRGLLGRGNMGAVYKARLPEVGTMVALKVLAPEETLEAVLGMETITRRFLEEVRIMGSLRHRHIARIWDFDYADDGKPFFTMEYFCNNLGMAISEHYMAEEPSIRLPVDQAARYARQTLEGLARMHDAGVVHRDVKPFNLLLTSRDEVKIIDFGLSRLRRELAPLPPAGAVEEAAASAEADDGPDNIKVGTPFYTAPEQEQAPESADGRADCYSVGVMLFRMLTGMLPPEPQDRPGNGNKDWSPVGEHANLPGMAELADMAPGWDEFFRTALAEAPDERFATARDMIRALGELEQAWKRRRALVCAPTEEEIDAWIMDCAPVDLRTEPVKVGPRKAGDVFPMDTLGRPDPCLVNRFLPESGNTVRDAATGLEWELGGTDYPGTWEEGHAHVARRNRERLGGHADWRLPTVDELLSLVGRPESPGDPCAPAIFGHERPLLWSTDRKSHTAAWFLNAAMGGVAFQDFTCAFHARAVRTAHEGDDS